MRKTILAATGITLMLAATAMGQRTGANNYNFPSPWNPAGVARDQVTQYVAYIWDDNGYSGGYGTEYNGTEWLATAKDPVTQVITDTARYNWTNGDRVGGTNDSQNWFDAPGGLSAGATGTFQNRDNIVENGSGQKVGLAWALHDLAKGGKTNGYNVPMTFNMITGLYVNVYGATWDDRESMFGFYRPSAAEGSHKRIPAVNVGRDMGIQGENPQQIQLQSNSIYRLTKGLMEANQEIGNHTVDHMETNSRIPGPATQFSKQTIDGYTNFWGIDGTPTFGFAKQNANVTPWGTTRNESDEFGQIVGNTAQLRGWALYAGQFIEKQTWKNAINFGEKILTMSTTGQNDKNGGLGMNANNVYGFRAPRLEVNSAMFFALKEENYLYDCGLEEGYEEHRNGTNFIWPYTMDNGVQNSWTQYSSGNRVFLDSTPQGLWQIPVNVVIVPDDKRSVVYDNYAAVMAGAGTPVDPGDKTDWLKTGKITAFDFNTWVLWGMTYANWMETMKNTLSLRMNGNRAPFHYGAHTDYYTNSYDNAVLMSEFNKTGWGLCVSSSPQWNTYKDRQKGMEDFVIYARSQNAEFVTGKQLIDKIKQLVIVGQQRATATKKLSEVSGVGSEWEFKKMGGSSSNLSSKTLNDLTGTIAIAPDEDWAVFATYFDAGTLTGVTHIQLDYKQTSASTIRLVVDGDETREVTLAHRFPTKTHIDGWQDNNNFGRASLRNSGMIPIAAFDYEPTSEKVLSASDYVAVDMSRVIGIEIQPLAPYGDQPGFGQRPVYGIPRAGNYDAKFEFKNFTVHTGNAFTNTDPMPSQLPNPETPAITLPKTDDPVSIAKVKANTRTLSLAGISNGALKLNVAQSGMYNISVFSANGRLLQSFSAQNLAAGVNTLKLNNLAKGVYMIKVQGIDTKQQLTKSALVM